MIEQPFDHNGECRYCDELGMHRADCAWLVEQLNVQAFIAQLPRYSMAAEIKQPVDWIWPRAVIITKRDYWGEWIRLDELETVLSRRPTRPRPAITSDCGDVIAGLKPTGHKFRQLRLLDVYRAGAEDAIKEIDRLRDENARLRAAPPPADDERRSDRDVIDHVVQILVDHVRHQEAGEPPEPVPATPHHVVVPLTQAEYFALRSLVAEHLLCPRRSAVYVTPVPEHVEVTPEALLTKLMEIDG
jgi:hypothetical protein